MRLASLALLVLLVGCASPAPKKPSPYRYPTHAPLLALGAHRKELP
jgi:uncharacterized lipoprotein YmbA